MMQMEVVQKAKALEEAKGALSKKEEEVKALQVKQIQQPQSHPSKGSSSNSNIFCYLCSRIEQFKAKNYKPSHRKTRGPRNRWVPPRVKQVWVRKDQIHLFRSMGKEKIKKTPKFIWVVKNREFPNLVKPPLEDPSLSMNASH